MIDGNSYNELRVIKDSDEKRLMHFKSETVIMQTKFLMSFLVYLLVLQVSLEQSMKGGDFAFDHVDGLH